MLQKRKTIILLICIGIGIICQPSLSVLAHREVNEDPDYSTNTDGCEWGWDTDYEYNFGLYNHNATEDVLWQLTTPYPIGGQFDSGTGEMHYMGFDSVNQSNGLVENIGPYVQRLEMDHGFKGDDPNTCNDKRGWIPYKAVWVDVNDANHMPRLCDMLQYRGQTSVSNVFSGHVYDYNENGIFVQQNEIKWRLEAEGYSSDDEHYQNVMGWFLKKNHGVWTDMPYSRWAEYWYRREKPKPYHYSTEVSNNDKHYENGSDYWIKGGSTATFKVVGYDAYKNSYGQSAQYSAAIKNSCLRLRSQEGKDYNFAKIVDAANSNDYNNDVYTSSTTLNKGSHIMTNAFISVRNNDKGNGINIDGFERNCLTSKFQICTKEELDLDVSAFHKNKYDKETDWSYGFEDGNNRKHNLLRIDSKAPKSNLINIELLDINNVKITAKITDERSGVDDTSIEATVWKNEKSNKAYKFKKISDDLFETTIDLSKDNLLEFGTFNISIFASDNVGNWGCVGTEQFNRINPTPLTDDLKVLDYDYKESENIFWVRPNEKTLSIETNSHFQSNFGIFPDKTYLIFKKDDKDNTIGQFASIFNTEKFGNDFDSKFTFIDDDNKAKRVENSNNNYLTNIHHLKAINDAESFKLYSMSSFNFKGKEYFSNCIDSNKWLKTDGVAPTGSAICNLDINNLNLSISVKNATDNGGSGLKKAWIELYPSELKNEKSKYKKIELNIKNGEATKNFNVYDLFNSEDILVDVYLEDNVGNIRKISSEKYDLLTVKARIVPSNNRDCGLNPSLKQGQEGILIITTTGAAQQLQITFPDELSKLDDTLNKTLIVEPQKYLVTEYHFFVPLEAQEKDYLVNVKAIKEGKTKNANADFSVNNSILDGLRTRRKY